MKSRKFGERDDELDRGSRGPSLADAPGTGNVRDHLLNLQRDYGNAAVVTALQRRPKAASTDAPGKRNNKKEKKKDAADDFAPKEPGEASAGRDITWLINQGNTYKTAAIGDKTPKAKARDFDRAADYYLGVMWLDPSPMNAQYLVGLYRESGDTKRMAYWNKVLHREIVLPRHKAGEEAVEDMTGKGF